MKALAEARLGFSKSYGGPPGLVAKLWPDESTNYRYEIVSQCNETGKPLKSVLAATHLIVLV